MSRKDRVFSSATVGRLLAMVRNRCPICKKRGGQHNEWAHIFPRDLERLPVASKAVKDAALAHLTRPKRQERDSADAVLEVQRTLRELSAELDKRTVLDAATRIIRRQRRQTTHTD